MNYVNRYLVFLGFVAISNVPGCVRNKALFRFCFKKLSKNEPNCIYLIRFRIQFSLFTLDLECGLNNFPNSL